MGFYKFLNYLANDEEKIKFAFKIYDMDEDGFISNGELFKVKIQIFYLNFIIKKVLKIMVGNNLTDVQL